MTVPCSCLIFSTDAGWSTRMHQALPPLVPCHHLDSPAKVQTHLEQIQSRVLLIDLQSPGALDLLTTVHQKYPEALVLAFGLTGSDPLIEADRLGVYASEDAALNHHRLTALLQRALDHLILAGENRILRSESLRLNAIAGAIPHPPPPEPDPTLDIRDFSAAMRHFTNVETLLQRLVDEVASSLRVSRVGIFCRTRDVASYRLRAGLRCMETSSSLDYGETHPQVLWFSVHTHAISRNNLDLIRDSSTRLMLKDLLDQMGAEVLLPLQSHNRLLGWLFVGPLTTGQPFSDPHLHRLIALTDCVSTTLENALLYEEATIQKTLAETLLHSIPNGIIAVDDDGIVRWYNDSARALLGVTATAAIGRPVEGLGSRLADLLRKTLGENGSPQSAEWADPSNLRNLVTRTQRLSNQARCLGAVAIVQDTTDQKSMEEKQERLERATFWTELAASMSHEVRNPLVAIKTFAQLLPERYQDKEFQNEFKDLVSSEVERLNGIVDQIHNFANPPPITLKPLSVRRCVDSACATVFPSGARSPIRVSISAPDDLPEIQGDERALTEAFAHLLTNSNEALAGNPKGEITISMHVANGNTDGKSTILILFNDNGPGIEPKLKDKLYSPFSTTKARGLGLGLPIARRTILDHHGDITLISNEFGVLATVRLPCHPPRTDIPS